MATHGQVKTASQAAPPPVKMSSERVPPVRETGRRRVKPPEFDYTRHHSTVTTFEEFRRYVEGYPNERGLMLYLYRLKPKIDMNLIGVRETMQMKIGPVEDMTESNIARRMGRGKYLLLLNDANRDRGQKEILRLQWTIDDPTAPDPVYDLRTLCLAEPENLDEINRLVERGMLLRDAAGNPRLRTDRDPLPGASPSNSNGHGMDGEIKDAMGQVMVHMVKQSMQQPTELLQTAVSIAKTLQPAQPPQGVTLEQIELMLDRRLAALQPSQNQNPFAVYDQVQGFVDKVRGGAAGLASAVTSDATLAGLAEVFRAGAVLIPEVVKGLEYVRAQRAATAMVVNQRAGAVGNNGAMPQQPQQPQPRQMTMAEKITEICTLGFQRMNEGIPGFDYAAYVCTWHPGGIDAFRFLSQYGATGTMGLMTTDPEAAKLLADPATREKVEAFLTDFFDYSPEPLPDDPEESEPAAAAPPPSN